MEKFLRLLVRGMVKFDRFILKRYLFIETPLYKLWWQSHANLVQKKLEGERAGYGCLTA